MKSVHATKARDALSRKTAPPVALVPAQDAVLRRHAGDLLALQDALEDLVESLQRRREPVPAPVRRALGILDVLEGRLAAAAIARDRARSAQKGETAVPWETVKKRLRL